MSVTTSNSDSKPTFDKPSVGQIAPDFTASIQTGEMINLDELIKSGKKVLLVFYPGDKTPGCTKQLCGIRDVYKEYKELGVVVLGINHANAKSHQGFIDAYKYPFDIIVDEGKEISRSYGQIGKFFASEVIKRAVYLIGENREVLYVKQGMHSDEEVLQFLNS
jgi:thioredoxin-dependent peroxiredoxin